MLRIRSYLTRSQLNSGVSSQSRAAARREMANFIVMKPSGLPLCEGEQQCAACGARGTVGRAMRTNQSGEPTEIHRFCAQCWPENAARLEARWNEELRLARDAWWRDPSSTTAPSGGTAFESATWHE